MIVPNALLGCSFIGDEVPQHVRTPVKFTIKTAMFYSDKQLARVPMFTTQPGLRLCHDAIQRLYKHAVLAYSISRKFVIVHALLHTILLRSVALNNPKTTFAEV